MSVSFSEFFREWDASSGPGYRTVAARVISRPPEVRRGGPEPKCEFCNRTRVFEAEQSDGWGTWVEQHVSQDVLEVKTEIDGIVEEQLTEHLVCLECSVAAEEAIRDSEKK